MTSSANQSAVVTNKPAAAANITHVAVIDHDEHRVSSMLVVNNAMSETTATVPLIPFKQIPLLHAFAIPLVPKSKKAKRGEMIVAVKTTNRNYVVLPTNEQTKAAKDLMVVALDATYSLEMISECQTVDRKAEAAHVKVLNAVVAADNAVARADKIKAKVTKTLEKRAKKLATKPSKKLKTVTPMANWPFPN